MLKHCFILALLFAMNHACARNISIYNNSFDYAQEYTDQESHLQYLNARYYFPVILRFIQWDTYDLMNSYAYADGNPVMNIDPSGHVGIAALAAQIGNFMGDDSMSGIVQQVLFGVALQPSTAAREAKLIEQAIAPEPIPKRIIPEWSMQRLLYYFENDPAKLPTSQALANYLKDHNMFAERSSVQKFMELFNKGPTSNDFQSIYMVHTTPSWFTGNDIDEPTIVIPMSGSSIPGSYKELLLSNKMMPTRPSPLSRGVSRESLKLTKKDMTSNLTLNIIARKKITYLTYYLSDFEYSDLDSNAVKIYFEPWQAARP